ncbi:MAG: UvrD-helicase domain-containing protein [Actinomycetota bacterium]
MSVCEGSGAALGPGGRELTDEQLEAVSLRDGPLLLDANAGSGKTTVMVERFVRAVLCDGVGVASILAITFTDKAASELRGRIRSRFVELDEPERAREAEGAFISTIHGFCARVLHSYPLDAELDPGFEVIDELQASRLRRLAFDCALESVIKDGGQQALQALAQFKLPELRTTIISVHDALRTQGQERPRLPDVTPRDIGAAGAQLLARAEELAGVLGGAKAKTDLAALEVVGVSRLRLDPDGAFADAEITLDGCQELKIPGRQSGLLKGEEAAGYRIAYGELRQACFDHAALPTYLWLGKLMAAFADDYAQRKGERSGLDFGDLELRTLALLRRHPLVRERYAKRFVHVMVDEFQDTNPLQLALLDELPNERRFVVGDAFQAIYRFRNADVDLFRAERKRLEALGRVRVLTSNYRSRPELLEAFNHAFAGAVFDQGFEPLVAGKLEQRDMPPPAKGPVVELLVTSKDDGWLPELLGATSSSAIWRLAEARLLAQRVRALCDGGRRAGEIVLLMRATTDMALFERALEDQGVPTYLIGGRGYWSGRQVGDLVAYLALLANPRDDLRLYEALCSELAGVCSDTLVLLAQAAGSRHICEVLDGTVENQKAFDQISKADAELLALFWSRFGEHRAAAPRLGLDALIERVMGDAGFDLAILAMAGGERRMANVRKLMRFAREYEAIEGRDLRGLVDQIDRLRDDTDGGDREGEAPIEGEDLDAVRIMTVHRAKGLEFPVVCVADLGREQFSGDQSYLRIDRNSNIGLKVPELGDDDDQGAFAWVDIAEVERAANKAEERRLFYVGMTRAREHLILSGAAKLAALAKLDATEPIGWIAAAVAGAQVGELSEEMMQCEATPHRGGWSPRIACSLNSPGTVGVVLAEDAQAPQAVKFNVPAPQPQPLAPLHPAPGGAGLSSLSQLSYTSISSYKSCGYRFYLERVLRLPAEAETASAKGDGVSAKLRGTVVHELLEQVDFADPLLPQDDAIAAVGARHSATFTEQQCSEIADLVKGFFGSELCRRLAGAETVLREEGFGFLLPCQGSDPLLINGAIDVLSWDGEDALIVDYKTDLIAKDAPDVLVAREYRTQQIVYALAALHAGAVKVDVNHLFLRRPLEPVSACFLATQRSELEDELAAMAAGIVARSYPVSTQPHRTLCQGCPGRASLCSWPNETTERELP